MGSIKTSICIGVYVQWYELDIIDEYFTSLKNAIEYYGSDVHVDILVNLDRSLEEFDGTEKEWDDHFKKLSTILHKYNFKSKYTRYNQLARYSIADYRREFNDKNCNEFDVLIWGESDMICPKEMFTIIDQLHQQVNDTTPKYISTFATCKMWDQSWKPLEHPDFTDKPFSHNDYTNWWSHKYTMTEQEMNDINGKTNEPEVLVISPQKFNGCGLVISSEVIKSGVNIPQSVFFVHEDTAMQLMINKLLPTIPQYHIKNILLVHNRNHPKKRNYINGESGNTMNEKRRSNDWYIKANKYSESNAYSIFVPNYKSYTWEDCF